MNRLLLLSFVLGVLAAPALAQPAERLGDDVYARILEEGTERSQVMQTLHFLTDVYGPRLTGSPQLDAAGAWTLQQMGAWGLENAQAEPWDWGHVGWTNERTVVHMVEPVPDALVAEVLAWTPSTEGAVTASAVHVLPPEGPTQTELDAYLDALRSGMAGAIALVGDGAVPSIPPGFERFLQRRRDDAEVEADYEPDNPDEGFGRRRGGGGEADTTVLSAREVNRQVDAFVLESGAAVRVDPARMEHGLIRAFSNRSFDPAEALPTLVMRSEDFGRITRLLQAGRDVTLEVDIQNTIYPDAQTEHNYTAEIVGTEMPDEVVMLGGHLDSWHAATGATDNAAGVAVMMEAVRILQALGLEPRRTIRVALWTGEEQGLLGSRAYVEQRLGTFEDPKPEYDGFGGYINVDAGTGRLRGATVFGPTEAAAVLEELLAPYDSLGVAGARPTFSRSLGGSDHTAFNQAGLPGISMGQDPIEYFTRTWHTNVDTYERILPEDMQQAAVVVAALAYGLAMRDELLPRFEGEAMPADPRGTN